MTKETLIISGFPGVGKSYLFNNNNGLDILDSDSSNFSWLEPGVRNPDFPNNYMEHIKESIGKVDVILVSSHKVVRDALCEAGIHYTIVAPYKNLRQEYLRLYKERGNADSFIDMMDKNWDNFINEIEQETFPTIVWLSNINERLSEVVRYITLIGKDKMDTLKETFEKEYKDITTIKNEIIEWIKEYFINQPNAKGAILGISGGKDSTVVGKLLVEALGADRVYGVLMPNSVQCDIDDSFEVCELLGIKYRVVDIGNAYTGLVDSIAYSAIGRIEADRPLTSQSLINIAPRLRMTTLYAIGTSKGYRVCGTSNLSETYVGYYTKFGDSGHDFNPIAHLTSLEVVSLGHELGLPAHLVDKTPSDGLTGKSDEDSLGITYRQIHDFIRQGTSGDSNVDGVIDKKFRHNLHKLYRAPRYEGVGGIML